MTRNQYFEPGRRPFAGEDKHDLRLLPTHVNGLFSTLNPTHARFEPQNDAFDSSTDGKGKLEEITAQNDSSSQVRYLWRSRDNRKGRHPLRIEQPSANGLDSNSKMVLPERTSNPRTILKTVSRMFTCYPVWDISWLVAYIFTLGSVVWCINGFFNFLPYIRPSSEFKGEVLVGGGVTAFIGAVLLFEVGSILLMSEAVNEHRAGCFGWAVEQLVDGNAFDGSNGHQLQLRAIPGMCTHHHQNKSNLVGRSAGSTDEKARLTSDQRDNGRTWQWFPTIKALREHYFHELGFIASFSQFMGATIFSIAGFTALPGIYNHMSPGLTDGIFWVPQVVGGTGFIVSGTLYMLETQEKWYQPAFRILGWHIAFWNLIGGIGFTLCGALGFAMHSHAAQYQASCATFWGSFAFLVGSVLQLYESLQKNPVEVVKQPDV